MLSVIIIAKNEASTIARCLQSVSFADEIIVLDSGSEDNTIAIAKQYTTHVYSTDWQGYGKQKQRALERASGDWVLNLDADEYLSPQLQSLIVNAIHANNADAYRIPIHMVFYNQPLKYSSSPKRHIRLFKRMGARYSDDIVHEKIVLPASANISKLSLPIHHHSFRDMSHAIDKMNRYSSYTAKIRLAQRKTPSLLRVVLSSCWMFMRCYLLQRGFLDGRAGFMLAVYNAESAFYRGSKQLYPDRDMETL